MKDVRLPADLIDDPRVEKLAKRHKDGLITTAALALYVCLLVACQRRRERLRLEEAMPTWLGPRPAHEMAADVLAHDLYRAGLLTWDHRIPVSDAHLIRGKPRPGLSQAHRQAIGQGVRRYYALRRAAGVKGSERSGAEVHAPNPLGMAAGPVPR